MSWTLEDFHAWVDPKKENRNSLENPRVSLSSSSMVSLVDATSHNQTGRAITPLTALQCTTAYACIKVLAETLATFPLQVFRRVGKEKEIAYDHPYYSVLNSSPNMYTTSYVFFTMIVAQVCVYSRSTPIILRGPGDSLSLYCLDQNRVKQVALNGKIYWEMTYANGEVERIDDFDVLNITSLSLDGVNCLSPVLNVAKNAIAMALATEEHNNRFFSNGARLGGVLKSPGALSQEAMQRLKASWDLNQAGLANAYRVAVLENGLDFQSIVMQSDHAQLAETRRFQVEEICRVFRVPPIFVGSYERALYANAEHQDIHLAKHTMTPWCRRIEQEFNKKLFDGGREYFCEFNMDGLQRGDFASRIDGFTRGIQGGIFMPNEARAYMNLPPVEGGDRLYIQGATVPLEMAGTQIGSDATPKIEEQNNV